MIYSCIYCTCCWLLVPPLRWNHLPDSNKPSLDELCNIHLQTRAQFAWNTRGKAKPSCQTLHEQGRNLLVAPGLFVRKSMKVWDLLVHPVLPVLVYLQVLGLHRYLLLEHLAENSHSSIQAFEVDETWLSEIRGNIKHSLVRVASLCRINEITTTLFARPSG